MFFFLFQLIVSRSAGPVPQGCLDLRALPVLPEACQGPQAPVDPPGFLAAQASQASMVPAAPRAQTDQRALKGLLDPQGLLDVMGSPVPRATMAMQAFLVCLVRKEAQECLGYLGIQGCRVPKEIAGTQGNAPATVATSSSRPLLSRGVIFKLMFHCRTTY